MKQADKVKSKWREGSSLYALPYTGPSEVSSCYEARC